MKKQQPFTLSSPSVPTQCLEMWKEFDLKKLAGLGNYAEIFVAKEASNENLRTIYGFTEKGHLICTTLNLISGKHFTKVINALAGSVVEKTLHSVDLDGDNGALPICLAHDGLYISVVSSLARPPFLRMLSSEKLVKTSIKSSNGLQPLSVHFSKSKSYVFACYKNAIDVLSLSHGTEDMLPLLERIDLILPKEDLADTCLSKTPLMPSINKDAYLYYLYRSDEVVEIPTLKKTREGVKGVAYHIKQVRIEGKAIESRVIIRVDLEARIKRYEWSNTMGKLAILLETNELVVVSTGDILKAFEIDDPRLKSEEYKRELLKWYSYKSELLGGLKSVHWMDHGNLLLTVTNKLEVLLFDSCLMQLKFAHGAEFAESLSLSNIESPKMKNPIATKVMEKEIAIAKEKLILKRAVITTTSDPFIISGNLPYNLLVYRIGFSLPWKEAKLNEFHIVSQHLENGRIEAAMNAVNHVEDPETFMQCFVHLSNYLMRRPSILAKTVVIKHLTKIHAYASTKPETDYLRNFLNQYYHQLGQRLLTSDFCEEAYKIALAIESAPLMRNIEQYCKWKGRMVMAEAAKKEAMKYDQNITTLAQEMTKISDYTHKALTGDDIQNVINDYHTLMNVSSIHELDLDEFNSWEINLKDYEKALQLELDGNYEEAKAIYEKNKLSADAKRAETLAHLTKNINQGVVQFVDVTDTTKKDKK